MRRIRRGEIRWADLNPVRGSEQGGRRPVVIVSHDVFNERSGTAIVMAVTSQPQQAGFPLTLELRAADMLKPSWVKISQVRTLSTDRIEDLIATLADEELHRLVEGLNEIVA
ncbi:MAG: type II toxin-antitoxin system PemK/MazF family toxin [Candidatus Bipolaricaulota bacterium]|nr:type II toxin-antitoxin system PemK/MazF family toxin [Candidatus Bipolaricaulota bacterium]